MQTRITFTIKQHRLFKKLFLSFLLLPLLTNYVEAQKIHALLFADVEDANIGNGCNADIRNFHSFLSSLQTKLNSTEKVDEHVYTYDYFSADRFKKSFSDIQSAPNDLIILYVSSHGDRSQQDTTDFPDIAFADGSASAYNLFVSLLKLPHKSCLGIIDACNIFRKETDAEKTLYPKEKTVDSITTTNNMLSSNITKLFWDNNFNLLITGSQPGVQCITNQDGSIFTSSLIKSFQYILSLNNPSIVNIDNALQRIKFLTLYESSRQIMNNTGTVLDPKCVPYYPMWQICTSGDFPCVPGTYLKETPAFPNMEYENLVNSLNFEIASFNKNSANNKFSLQAQTKSIELRKAETELAERANKNFNFTERFGNSSDFIAPQPSRHTNDVSPTQFIINYSPVALSDIIMKSLNTQNKFLISVNIVCSDDLFTKIDHVDYYLNPAYKNPIKTSNNPGNGFKEDIFLNNDFYLIAKVTFKDQTNITLGKQLIVPKN